MLSEGARERKGQHGRWAGLSGMGGIGKHWVHGRRLMELREKLKRNPEDLKVVAPPPLANFRLLGEAIPTIVAEVSKYSGRRRPRPRNR